MLILRREITKEKQELLYKSVKEKKLYLSKKEIERIFWRPMKFIKSISNLEEVQRYWRFDHNKHLKEKKFEDFEERFEKLCMVIPCELVSVKKNNAVVKSEFFDGTVELKTDFVDIRPGDKVTKHYDYICEKIPEDLYHEMIESLKKIV
jgi:hydrogenase maturation factor